MSVSIISFFFAAADNDVILDRANKPIRVRKCILAVLAVNSQAL